MSYLVKTTKASIVLFLFNCLFLIDLSLCETKRIILEDPTYLQQQMDHLQIEIQRLQVKVTSLEETVTTLSTGSNSVVYTRWGRMDCPSENHTELVYSGYLAGTANVAIGGASNTICLPSDPTWGPNKDTYEHAYSLIYGGEYEDTALFGMPDWKQDIPCSVCRSTLYSSSIMVAGRINCHPTWTEAYHGNLATGYDRHPGNTQYVCLDQHPQAVAGGSRNTDGHVLYGVKTSCGSLPCPPYENNKQLACVVCMK